MRGYQADTWSCPTQLIAANKRSSSVKSRVVAVNLPLNLTLSVGATNLTDSTTFSLTGNGSHVTCAWKFGDGVVLVRVRACMIKGAS